jgi:hypothetical protein
VLAPPDVSTSGFFLVDDIFFPSLLPGGEGYASNPEN